MASLRYIFRKYIGLLMVYLTRMASTRASLGIGLAATVSLRSVRYLGLFKDTYDALGYGSVCLFGCRRVRYRALCEGWS